MTTCRLGKRPNNGIRRSSGRLACGRSRRVPVRDTGMSFGRRGSSRSDGTNSEISGSSTRGRASTKNSVTFSTSRIRTTTRSRATNSLTRCGAGTMCSSSRDGRCCWATGSSNPAMSSTRAVLNSDTRDASSGRRWVTGGFRRSVQLPQRHSPTSAPISRGYISPSNSWRTGRLHPRLSVLNERIRADRKNLGPGFEIGHSFFCPGDDDEGLDDAWYEAIVRREIEPLLREYWFDRPEHVEEQIRVLLA